MLFRTTRVVGSSLSYSSILHILYIVSQAVRIVALLTLYVLNASLSAYFVAVIWSEHGFKVFNVLKRKTKSFFLD